MAAEDPTGTPNAGTEGTALGFSEGQAQKKQERYNTQFLVANFEKEERRTRIIVIGVVAAVLIAGGVGLLITSKSEPKPMTPAAGEPVSGTPKAETPKPAAQPRTAADTPK